MTPKIRTRRAPIVSLPMVSLTIVSLNIIISRDDESHTSQAGGLRPD